MKKRYPACTGLLLVTTGIAAFAQLPASSAVPVDNFVRAETDMYFGDVATLRQCPTTPIAV